MSPFLLQIALERVRQDLADGAPLACRLQTRSTEERFVEHGADFSPHVKMLSRDQDGVKITCLPHPLVLDSPVVNNI
jgi:hypothetical protein